MHQYLSGGTFDVSLIATDEFGCTDTTETALDITERVEVTITSDALERCEYEANFELTATLSGDYTGIEWDVEGTNYTANPLNVTFSSTGTKNVEFVALNPSGCHDTATLDLMVHPIEEAEFTMDPEYCDDGELQVQSNSNNGTSIYTWKLFAEKMTGADLVYDLTGKTPGTHTLGLHVETEFGCVDSITNDFEIRVRPVADISAQDVCFPELVTVTNSSHDIDANTLFNIRWGDGQETGMVPDESSWDHAYIAGNYNMELVAANGICRDSAQLSVNVFDKPLASFLASADPDDATSAIVVNQSTGGTVNYWWFGSLGQEENNAPTFKYDFGTPGDYNIILVVESPDDCRDTAQQSVEVYGKVDFLIPSAYSPNADGLNDGFSITPNHLIQSVEIILANRWGEVVWKHTGTEVKMWPEPIDGIYAYSITITDLQGMKHHHQGTLQILK